MLSKENIFLKNVYKLFFETESLENTVRTKQLIEEGIAKLIIFVILEFYGHKLLVLCKLGHSKRNKCLGKLQHFFRKKKKLLKRF